MRITDIKTRAERFELLRPYSISYKTVDAVTNWIVELYTDTGLLGFGAAAPSEYVTGETDAACQAALQIESLEWLLGQDVRSLPALCRELSIRLPHTPAARAAVDMALYDLLAQHLELPLVDMLGRSHQQLPTSITIGIKSVSETLIEADEYLGRGFRVLKVKLGQSLEEDLERLHKLRERVGPDIVIRVDPNQGYSPQQVTHFVEQTSDLAIEFLEQPVAVEETAALRALPANIRGQIAVDESLLNARDALDLIVPPCACGIFNIKLMKCGGLYPALTIALIAENAGLELMWGCNDESIISISAALHLALASPATRYLDLDGSLDLARDVASGGFILEQGFMRTSNEPGLGVRRAD